MPSEGRSARRRPERLARRRRDVRGFDEGGSRQSFYRRRWFRPIIAIGVAGILVSLIGGGIFMISGSNPQGGSMTSSTAAAPAPVRRINDTDPTAAAADLAVNKPQFDAAPAFALAPSTDYRAVITLESGSVELDLFEDVAPVHVNNFVFLAEQRFFDGLTFHRVIEGFVAQGGDPTGTGTGGAGYALPDEDFAAAGVGDLSLGDTGLISMARSGSGASSSQFFITLNPQAQLDGLNFTAFGRVTSGLELVSALPKRDPAAIPVPPAGARILSVTIEVAPAAAAE